MAMAEGARRSGGHDVQELPLSDGGEGFADVLVRALGGEIITVIVSDAMGEPIQATYGMLPGDIAVVETATAVGLAQLAARNDPVTASSRGAGELIVAALAGGARRILVGVGGSAMTDGGLGAMEALGWSLRGVEVQVACDVTTPFVDAARIYGPQKGATNEQIPLLTERLRKLTAVYIRRTGVRLDTLPGSGAAGGLAGGLAALGATLTPGLALVAEATGLDSALAGSDVVVTGEGSLDRTSLSGKVVGEVLARASVANVGQRVAIAGRIVRAEVSSLSRSGVHLLSLTERAVSPADPMADAAQLLTDAVMDILELPRP
jgi:glycerate 2-kinase